jgi:hypothetical protein
MEKIMSATNVAFVPLANNKCNTCGHLVSHAKNFHDNCHFTKGNANCPAKVFQLGVGVNVEKASQAIAEAFHACDVEALQKHINRLAGFKPVQTREVLSLVFNKTALLYGIEISDSDEGDDEDAEQEAEDGDDGEDDADGQEQQGNSHIPTAEQDAEEGDDASDDADADAEALTDLADPDSDDTPGEAAEGAEDGDEAGADTADAADDEDEWHAE